MNYLHKAIIMNGNCHFVFGASVGTTLCLTGVANQLYANINGLSQLSGLSSIPTYTTSANPLEDVINGSANTPNAIIFSLFICTCLIGSIFPDIDSPKSNFGQLTAPLSTVIGKIGKAKGKTGKNHRGIFHDIGIYIILGLLSYSYFPAIIGFFVGAISHLILDAFNPMGVPVLFGVKHLHFGKVYSGSNESVVLTWALSIMCLIFGFLVYYNII